MPVDTKVIDWIAFPRNVQLSFPSDEARWRAADASRDVQDEYLEWCVTRDAAGKIVRVAVTCEAPEYWRALYRDSPAKVLALYREHVNKDVKEGDLLDRNQPGNYNARNKWNTGTADGAMHLVQRNNSLFAEIKLASDATVIRATGPGGADLTTPQDLVACSRYGDAGRNSDPHIGSEVNKLARAGALITLANPVGLYIHSLNVNGWKTPDDADPMDYWKVTRGSAENPVRAVYEVPEGAGYVVGDITIGGRPIEYGAQIVDFIRVRLTGVAHSVDRDNRDPAPFCFRG